MRRKKLESAYNRCLMRNISIYVLASVVCIAYWCTVNPGYAIMRGFLSIFSFKVTECAWCMEMCLGIYPCAEGVRNESPLSAVHKRFPSCDIRLHYLLTGNSAVRLKMKGAQSEADIVLDLEGGYINQVSD